jgi:hypothetical protein
VTREVTQTTHADQTLVAIHNRQTTDLLVFHQMDGIFWRWIGVTVGKNL